MDEETDEWPEDDDDETEVIICPACGTEVYEDAEQCPVCGEWITVSTHPFAGRGLWFVGLGLLGILATIIALVAAGF